MFYILLILSLFSAAIVKAETRKLRIAAYDIRPYVTETDEEPGYLFEIIANAFKRAGYDIDVQFYPSLRAQSLVESGERDVLIPSYRSESYRSPDTKLIYSLPIQGSEIVMIKRRETALSKLPKVVGNSLLLSQRAANFGNPVLTEKSLLPSLTEKTIQIIDMLNQRRIDYAVVDKLAAANAIVSRRLPLVGSIDFVSPPISKKEFYVAFSRKLKAVDKVLQDFNRALADMNEQGQTQAYVARYGYQALEEDDHAMSILMPLNEHSKNVRDLSGDFLKKHPGLRINWYLLEENLLRRRVLTSLTLAEPIFDVISLGQVNIPLYATRGWISELASSPKSYNQDDILPVVQKDLSYDGKRYALPLYHESSMTFYRKDLFAQKKLVMPDHPSYYELRKFAAQLHDPKAGVNGICLRGKAGPGENTSNILAIVRAFGGQFFDEDKELSLTSEPWREAIQVYADLLLKYGPEDPTQYGYSELLQMFAEGHCAIWVDASVAAGFLTDAKYSKVSDAVGFAYVPHQTKLRNMGWSWTWAMAVAGSSRKKALAQEFMEWASSEEYTTLVGRTKGWKAVPPGTRVSTYKNSEYQKVSTFAPFVFNVLQEKDSLAFSEDGRAKSGKILREPRIETLEVPVFQALRIALGLNVVQVLKGNITVKRALQNTEQEVKSVMYQSGYYTAVRPDEPSKIP